MLYLEDNLLLSIVKHGTADHFVSLAVKQGVHGATVIPAKGSATSAILRMLGLGDTSKEIVMILTNDAVAEKVMDAAYKDKQIQGVCALTGTSEEGDMNTNWKMINVIVNAGYADDIMETARKAGAPGGTVVQARGTARSCKENRFLGVTIVPEKQMVMILAKSDEAEKIVNAIEAMPCLQEPGVGIIFVQDVKKFVNLGNAK